MSDTVPLTAEIGVGSMVRLRTEAYGVGAGVAWLWVVTRVGRWWPRRGMIELRFRRDRPDLHAERVKWVYPSEVELVEVKR